MKLKNIYFIILVLATALLSGCTGGGMKQLSGEGIFDFERYSNRTSVDAEDCVAFNGIAINDNEYRIIDNIRRIKQVIKMLLLIVISQEQIGQSLYGQ